MLPGFVFAGKVERYRINPETCGKYHQTQTFHWVSTAPSRLESNETERPQTAVNAINLPIGRSEGQSELIPDPAAPLAQAGPLLFHSASRRQIPGHGTGMITSVASQFHTLSFVVVGADQAPKMHCTWTALPSELPHLTHTCISFSLAFVHQFQFFFWFLCTRFSFFWLVFLCLSFSDQGTCCSIHICHRLATIFLVHWTKRQQAENFRRTRLKFLNMTEDQKLGSE